MRARPPRRSGSRVRRRRPCSPGLLERSSGWRLRPDAAASNGLLDRTSWRLDSLAAGPCASCSPSVSRKNRSSSVASSGVSARMPDARLRRARATARRRAARRPESQGRARRCAACSTPGLGAHDLQRARVVGRAQPVASPALAAQIGERALVDDTPAIDDRHAVAELLHLGQLVAGEQHGDPFVG